MATAALNLLAWRERCAVKKIIHDGILCIVLSGAIALIGALFGGLIDHKVRTLMMQKKRMDQQQLANQEHVSNAYAHKRLLMQIEQWQHAQKNNPLQWQRLATDVQSFYHACPGSIELKTLIWHPEGWKVTGYAESKEALMQCQENLTQKNISLDIARWQPNDSLDDQENFLLSMRE